MTMHLIKRMGGFYCILVGIVLILVSDGCSKSSPTTPTMLTPQGRVLSVTATPRTDPPPTDQDFVDALNMVYDAGARGIAFSAQWSELEPSPESYRLSDFADLMNYANGRDLTVLITIASINTVKREVPPDLSGRRWNNKIMIQRMIALLDRMGPHFTSRVKYLSIGNEVDIYLTEQGAGESDDYIEFFRAARDHIHQRWPWIQVGITTTFEGLAGNRGSVVQQLNRHTDVVILTYYPLTPGMVVREPGTVHQDFQTMVAFAGNRLVVLQEIGYPAGQLNMSSPAMQAEFVRQFFDAWDEVGGAIPFLNYFQLHDFPDDLCDAFLGYYGISAPAFREFLCTLGLRKANGEARPAWRAFKEAAAAHGFP